MYLLDTVTISEMRKGERAHPSVRAWLTAARGEMWLSVLTVGELWNGIERLGRRDAAQAKRLCVWYDDLRTRFGSRILQVDTAVAERWGTLNAPDPRPTVDSLIAATAWVHKLTVVTRNTRDFAGTGVDVLNPWEAAPLSVPK